MSAAEPEPVDPEAPSGDATTPESAERLRGAHGRNANAALPESVRDVSEMTDEQLAAFGEAGDMMGHLSLDADLTVTSGVVDINGSLAGSVLVTGGKLIISGSLIGSVTNDGGELDITGSVVGQIVGEHTVNGKAPVVEEEAPEPDVGQIGRGGPSLAQKASVQLKSKATRSDRGSDPIIGKKVRLKPEPDTVLVAGGVSKHFSRDLQTSMKYGLRTLAKSVVGLHDPPDRELKEDEFWAVKDVSIQLQRGNSVGIMGINGSGKTTLLRLLAGVYPPDQGGIMINGTAHGIIGIGAGMHPHLTGTENVFLNGAILGLETEETAELYDEIVEFAELDYAMDAPLAMYSSGMRVRLGFSVLAALRPDVMMIDEAFAVGDLAFREKCFGVIADMRKTSAVLVVSQIPHLLQIVCDHGAWLDGGEIVMSGPIGDVSEPFLREMARRSPAWR